MPRTTLPGDPLPPRLVVSRAGLLPLGLAPRTAAPGDAAVARSLARVDDEVPAPG